MSAPRESLFPFLRDRGFRRQNGQLIGYAWVGPLHVEWHRAKREADATLRIGSRFNVRLRVGV